MYTQEDEFITRLYPIIDPTTGPDHNHLVTEPSNATGAFRALPIDCSHDKAFLAIVITVIPLGAILTLLIVLALVAFHKSIRATKIYDNCTSSSANYVYHIEIRTGDTSATYTRRKATLTIDMFDENQATLARIAIPGHVIFGRKESPIDSVDDERFGELRVTRLWLYRATQLKRISTIRITHTCSEPEARIMIYGVELRTGDEGEYRNRLFFPVMNYITAYGAVGRPNACFDADPIGTISTMGDAPDRATISEHLTHLDYAMIVFFFCSTVLYLSTLELIHDSFIANSSAVYKGALLGCVCFAASLTIGLLIRFVIKQFYSQNVGRGTWAVIYYLFAGLLLLTSLALWIYTTFLGYKYLCSNHYDTWLLSICVAVIEAIGFTIMCTTVSWMVLSNAPVYAQELVMADDGPGTSDPITAIGSLRKTAGSNKMKSNRQRSPNSAEELVGQELHTPQTHHLQQPPTGGGGGGGGPWQQTGRPPNTPPLLMGVPQPFPAHHHHNYPHPAYGQPSQPSPPYMMTMTGAIPPGAQTTTYKVAPFTPPTDYPAYSDATRGYPQHHQQQQQHHHQQPHGPGSPFYHGQGQTGAPHAANPPPARGTTTTPPTVFHTMQLAKTPVVKHQQHAPPLPPSAPYGTYQQQVAGGGGGGVTTSAGKQPGTVVTTSTKKTGSQESTGSTYYQQLMKNKGGVKSISQYGELMKKNKK